MKALGCLGIVAVDLLCLVLYGHGGSVLWRWFAVPLGAPAIGGAHLVGLATLFLFLRHKDLTKEPKVTVDTVAARLTNTLVRYVSALGIGYAIVRFM